MRETTTNITLSINDNTVHGARRCAEAMGTSVNQLVREYLDKLAGKGNLENAAAEFEALSSESRASSAGWKFNREELHER